MRAYSETVKVHYGRGVMSSQLPKQEVGPGSLPVHSFTVLMCPLSLGLSDSELSVLRPSVIHLRENCGTTS